jgi:hypothetical protein
MSARYAGTGFEGQGAGDAVSGQAHELQEAAQQMVERAREQLAGADKWLRQTMEERPLLVLGSALAIGFLIGKAVSR